MVASVTLEGFGKPAILRFPVGGVSDLGILSS
jgi:hypothetical protein